MRAAEAPRLGLYLHVPFCRKRCTYCAFVTRGVSEARVTRFLDALRREIARQAPLVAGRRVTTVFIGGGTPTVLSASQWEMLGGWLRAAIDLSAVEEFTSEANPENLTDERVAAMRAAGVTRVSIGAQTADDATLRALNRTHAWTSVESAVRTARDGGLDAINLDCMFGLPGETAASWRATLEAFAALAPSHLSFYGLGVEAGTVLERQVSKGTVRVADDDDQAARYHEARAWLAAGGWDHYEVSNAARPGQRSLHNLGYWRRDEYLGLGPGAHSFLGAERWANVADIAVYAQQLAAGDDVRVERETLRRADVVAETMFLGLRVREGVELAQASVQCGVQLAEVYADVLARHVAQGSLRREGDRVWLPAEHWFVAHDVLADFLEPPLG